MARINRLKARQINSLSPGLHADGGNLYLRVRQSGTRSWVFRYRKGDKTREIGLGPVHACSLARARELAQEMRAAHLEGNDPAIVLQAHRPASKSFEALAREAIASWKSGWRNKKHADQWINTLEAYAFPVIGHLAPRAIELRHIVDVLQPLWESKTETANRIRQRIEAVLDYAAVHGYRERDKLNPASWRGNLNKVLPAPSRVRRPNHHTALPYSQVPELMDALAQMGGIAPYALRFLILTAARSGEVRHMQWTEVDLENQIWTVPAERMKAGKIHRVPLSNEAVRVLNKIKPWSRNGLVFPGAKAVLSDTALSKALHSATEFDCTVHGLRSSFRDWGAETTTFPSELLEHALAHVNKNQTEAAYQRSDLFEKRRELMDAWESYCLSSSNNIVKLSKTA